MGAQVNPEDPKACLPKKKRIGLLFVHGIGEQERFEHLTGSVRELAELMLGAILDSSVSVIDRTRDWDLKPGVPDPDKRAQMTLTLRTPDKHYAYECNEVWWADLGTRSGMLDSITFWLWGLGQWAAPIYQELDGAQMSKRPAPNGTLESDLVVLPASVAGKLGEECLARFRLAMAALAAAFIGSTWALAKRVMKFLGAAPSPTLIVRYVGDVRTYEERAKPGDTAISDPGKPRRVGIRRRMVSEMVNLATRSDIDEWWILAHSQGTVLAYNGLTEIGHTLPNYLPEEQWKALDDKFKVDPNCLPRSKVYAMVPARPAWLVTDKEVINRDLLFEKLRGFITYGSPLDKFAALWPRIVGTATDRKDGKNPLRNCTWLNIAAPQDPVAGMLCRYPAGPMQAMEGAIPQVKNIALPFRANYGLAHIRYFTGAERWVDTSLQRTKKSIVAWLAGEPEPEAVAARPFRLRLAIVYIPYLLIIAALGLATAALVAVVAGLADTLFQWGSKTPVTATGSGFIDRLLHDIRQLFGETLVICGLVLGVALAVIIGFGLWRWYSESRLNLRLARADAGNDANRPENAGTWKLVIEMLARQRAAGLTFLLLALPLMAAGLWIDLGRYRDGHRGLYGALISLGVMALAILMQALINWKTSRKVTRSGLVPLRPAAGSTVAAEPETGFRPRAPATPPAI
jgi:hypothetical protein